MLNWLRKKKEAPLTGAPAVRRQKTYSAESGYVYQYFYEGQRPASATATQALSTSLTSPRTASLRPPFRSSSAKRLSPHGKSNTPAN